MLISEHAASLGMLGETDNRNHPGLRGEKDGTPELRREKLLSGNFEKIRLCLAGVSTVLCIGEHPIEHPIIS